ncbi:hypothetical protein AX774_g553 [Zancudomyces culisetae]|uniref:Uncharacterized protein n=1 Tax=Zancudomyces culisetae TaxID=1213189 RepID=A0A1R1PY64_ZANCU|nr:hypothetical protein AX774_g553 [Zancudomyces culisetae]|eukprot:OMH85890.1 hypothetical protein AX774_g553 [Zancudomyces culisetae]
MVNIQLTSALLIASSFVAGANIPNAPMTDANGYGNNRPNSLECCHARTLEIKMFNTNFYKDEVGTKTVKPNRCYNLPNINSCVLDGGEPGEGKIMFFTEDNCMGKGRSNLRSQWLYPGNMDGDLGGRAKSVLWLNPVPRNI